MGLRFRRSVRLFPGVRLNFSGSGISTSFGARGAHVTYGHGHVRTTIGLPGTGISYTSISKHHGTRSPSAGNPSSTSGNVGGIFTIAIVAIILIWIVSGLSRSNRHEGSSAATPIPEPVAVRPQPVAEVPHAEAHETYSVATDVLNQRNRPNGTVIGILHRGALVDVFQIEQGWARISSVGYPPRWVSATLLCKGETCAAKKNQGNGPSN